MITPDGREREKSVLFWTSVLVSFVLLVHNGTEPVFLVAYALLPIVVFLFHKKQSPWPLVVYLLVFGALGRYTRYFRENYASDALLATRDYLGYFLSGRHPYKEMIMAQSGLTPFTYLPFSLFWYAPAQIFGVDLRFFEMVVSTAVPVVFALVGWAVGSLWQILPALSVVALTPFLLDLGSDGSNDNSAIFLLLVSIALLLIAHRKKDSRWGLASAVSLGLAAAFKHYLAFYLLYFVPYAYVQRTIAYLPRNRYLLVLAGTLAVVVLPVILTAPAGFWRSIHFIEISNWHKTWGWNVWVAIRDGLGLVVSKEMMWVTRTALTLGTIAWCFRFLKLARIRSVFIATGVTMLAYLILSNWTSYAYFTFLVPILALAAVFDDNR